MLIPVDSQVPVSVITLTGETVPKLEDCIQITITSEEPLYMQVTLPI